MSKKKTKNKLSTSHEFTGWDYFGLILLVISAAIVPLIVFMKSMKLTGILLDSWTGKENVSDFFSYYKAQVLVLCMVFLSIYLVVSYLKKRIHLNKLFIPMGIYFVMVLLSALFAEHKGVAFYGFTERYEGFFVLLAYCVLTLAAFLVIRDEESLQTLVTTVFISVCIIAILGLTQFYGVDFFETTLGRKLILPKLYEDLELSFNFSGQKIMYTTVYNPNYLGSLSALLLPVSLGLYLTWAETNNLRKKILGLVYVAATFILFLGGMSRAGILGGSIALVIFVILFRKKIIKSIKNSLIVLLMLTAIYLFMDLTSGGLVTREVLNTLPSSLYANEYEGKDGPEDNEGSTFVKYFQIENGEVVFQTETEGIKISYDTTENALIVKDLNGDELAITEYQRSYSLDNEQYENYEIIEYASGFSLIWNDYSFDLVIHEGKLVIKEEDGKFATFIDGQQIGAKEIRVENNKFIFDSGTEVLNVTYDEETGTQCMDGNGTKLQKVMTEMTYSFIDERYSLYYILPMQQGFYLKWNDLYMPFKLEDGNFKYMIKLNKTIDKFEKPETFGFEGAELFASSRGYIWSRSIPMIKETLLLGHGPDTYAIYFPQAEVDAKINFLDGPNRVVDKPHSWYLQLAINTGLISLIAMLVFLAWYWIKGFFVFIKDVDGMEKAMGAAILCGVAGYLIAAVFNDSTVSVAPVFWTLLGVGIAMVCKYAPKKNPDEVAAVEGKK